MVAVHKGLGQNAAGRFGRGDHFIHLIQAEGKRLFTQHMLARLQRLDRPLRVQMVGQADIHGVNLIRIEHRLIAAKRTGQPPVGRIGIGRRLRPAGHSHDLSPRRLADGGNQPPVDIGRRNKSPSYLRHKNLLHFALHRAAPRILSRSLRYFLSPYCKQLSSIAPHRL